MPKVNNPSQENSPAQTDLTKQAATQRSNSGESSTNSPSSKKKAKASKKAKKTPAFNGKRFARRLSTGPGVYVMKDEAGKPLYVGKAKNLRARVGSYFDAQPKIDRIMLMLSRVRSMDVSLTRTEGEALLLENEWIKSLKPYYNVLLRDDKSYPYLYLDTRHAFPRVAFHRGARSRKGRYFGPFPSAHSVRESIDLIQKLFQLRNCEDTVFSNRSRPCLQHQIGRCTAPCVGLVSESEYASDLDQAMLFLNGRNDLVIERLIERMEEAARNQRYEQAAALRDQIATLRSIQAQQFVAGQGGDVDIIALAQGLGQAVVQVTTIRGGRNLGQRAHYPARTAGKPGAEIMQAFLGQYFQRRLPPPLLLLSHAPEDKDLLAEVFSEQAGRKVRLVNRPRGDRAQWLNRARKNAENALKMKQIEASSQQAKLDDLTEWLKLDEPPEWIECFDISHLSGELTVGSCVVFDSEGPVKSRYRRFNLSGIAPGDDYAAMAQVLTRRYSRLQKEAAGLPDLIIIDGGKGQLSTAREVLDELGITGPLLMSIAKGAGRRAGFEDWLFDRPKKLLRPGPESPASHLVQHIRDEAHRFAITGHRQRRQKKMERSVLEEIPGIGANRRRQLLKHFGGMKGVEKAGVDELARVSGINRTLAQAIYRHLHESS